MILGRSLGARWAVARMRVDRVCQIVQSLAECPLGQPCSAVHRASFPRWGQVFSCVCLLASYLGRRVDLNV